MKKIFLSLFAGMMATPLAVIAQGPPPIITHPDQVVGLLSSILGYVWTILGIIVVMMFLYAGFTFITAAGEQDKITRAKNMITYSLIGVVVMLLAGGVMLLIENFLRGA